MIDLFFSFRIFGKYFNFGFISLRFQNSIYLATATDSLRESVKPEKLADWDSSLHDHHSVASDLLKPGQDGLSFLPRQCCSPDRELDQKTPLFFKQEFFGRGMISLGEFINIGEINMNIKHKT